MLKGFTPSSNQFSLMLITYTIKSVGEGQSLLSYFAGVPLAGKQGLSLHGVPQRAGL